MTAFVSRISSRPGVSVIHCTRAIARFHAVLDWSAAVLEEFSGWFAAKQSPAQFMWQSFDLSLTRFTGRPSGVAATEPVTREAYTHEVFLVGFNTDNPWTGYDASLYAFMVPEPPRYREARLVGGEHTPSGIAMLPWDAVRAAADPRALTLQFLQSAYEAAFTSGGLDTAEFASRNSALRAEIAAVEEDDGYSGQ